MKNYFWLALLAAYLFSQCQQPKESDPQTKNSGKDTNHTAAVTASAENELYELSLDELLEINVVSSNDPIVLLNNYELSVEDLMALQIVKELEIDTQITVAYDIPLQELLKIDVNLKSKDQTLHPSYEMSLAGLQAFEIIEKSNVRKKITISYDISLDGLMKLEVCCSDSTTFIN